MHTRITVGGRPGWRAAEVWRPLAALAALAARLCPLCPFMRQSQVEAFRARIMIVASIGLYLPRTGHDHETAWCTIKPPSPDQPLQEIRSMPSPAVGADAWSWLRT